MKWSIGGKVGYISGVITILLFLLYCAKWGRQKYYKMHYDSIVEQMDSMRLKSDWDGIKDNLKEIEDVEEYYDAYCFNYGYLLEKSKLVTKYTPNDNCDYYFKKIPVTSKYYELAITNRFSFYMNSLDWYVKVSDLVKEMEQYSFFEPIYYFAKMHLIKDTIELCKEYALFAERYPYTQDSSYNCDYNIDLNNEPVYTLRLPQIYVMTYSFNRMMYIQLDGKRKVASAKKLINLTTSKMNNPLMNVFLGYYYLGLCYEKDTLIKEENQFLDEVRNYLIQEPTN